MRVPSCVEGSKRKMRVQRENKESNKGFKCSEITRRFQSQSLFSGNKAFHFLEFTKKELI